MRFQFTIPATDSSMKDQKMFQFKASDKSTGKPLLVNGQSEFMATPTIPLAPTTTLVVHKLGQEWENIRSSYLGSGVTSQTSGTTGGDGSSTSSSTGSSGSSTSSLSSDTSSTSSTSTTTSNPVTASTSTVKLVFSSRNADDDVSIQEKGDAFTNINIPRKTFAMHLAFDILSTIQSLDLSAVAGGSSGGKNAYYLNGEKNLKIDTKVPPSAVIVHEKGFDWQKELSEIRKSLESSATGNEVTSLKKFKIHVRNEAGEDVRFQQKQDGSVSGSGPVVEVPKGVLASVDYVDKDDTGKLTFVAVSKKDTATSYLLNGQKEFIVDETNLSKAGQYVVVHKKGADWETYLKEMTGGGSSSSSSSTTLGGGSSTTTLGGNSSTGSTTLGGGSSMTTLGGNSSSGSTTLGGGSSMTTLGGNSSTGSTTLGGGSSMTTLGGNSSSGCLLYTSPSPRDATLSRMPSSA